MNKYDLIERLGAGSFGAVHLAKNKETGEEVVVKERGPTKFNPLRTQIVYFKNVL